VVRKRQGAQGRDGHGPERKGASKPLGDGEGGTGMTRDRKGGARVGRPFCRRRNGTGSPPHAAPKQSSRLGGGFWRSSMTPSPGARVGPDCAARSDLVRWLGQRACPWDRARDCIIRAIPGRTTVGTTASRSRAVDGVSSLGSMLVRPAVARWQRTAPWAQSPTRARGERRLKGYRSRPKLRRGTGRERGRGPWRAPMPRTSTSCEDFKDVYRFDSSRSSAVM
jgi:hypothetical protein